VATDVSKFAVESAKLLMKRWLESIRDNERVVKILTWVFAITLIGFILVFITNDRAGEQKPFPTQLYYIFGIPSLALIAFFITLQRIEKKYLPLPPPMAEDLERERLTKEAPISDAKRDSELALEAEWFIFSLLNEYGIALTKAPMSPMAQDMAGAFYTFERPLVLPEDFVFPDNHVLEIERGTRGKTIVVTRFTISSVWLHTYATFVVKPQS
jgi:hypothetical protein